MNPAKPSGPARSSADLVEFHLREQLGAWPPSQPVEAATSAMRTTPGWNGAVLPFFAVTSPVGTVISVPPDQLDEARGLLGNGGDQLDMARLARVARRATGRPGRLAPHVLRWPEEFSYEGRDVGVWMAADDPRLPEWLRKYGDVLVVLDHDVVVASAARKRHDQWGHELMADTLAAYRGQGYARDMMAKLARRVLAEGALPTTVHRPDNAASIRVNEALGFLDRGFRTLDWESAPSVRSPLRRLLARARIRRPVATTT